MFWSHNSYEKEFAENFASGPSKMVGVAGEGKL